MSSEGNFLHWILLRGIEVNGATVKPNITSSYLKIGFKVNVNSERIWGGS